MSRFSSIGRNTFTIVKKFLILSGFVEIHYTKCRRKQFVPWVENRLIELGKRADPSIADDGTALRHGPTQLMVNSDQLLEWLPGVGQLARIDLASSTRRRTGVCWKCGKVRDVARAPPNIRHGPWRFPRLFERCRDERPDENRSRKNVIKSWRLSVRGFHGNSSPDCRIAACLARRISMCEATGKLHMASTCPGHEKQFPSS